MNFKTGLILGLFACSFLSVSGQRNSVVLGSLSNVSVRESGFTPINFGANVGYFFTNNFCASAVIENAYAMFSKGNTDKNYINTTAGASLGYNFYTFEKGILAIKGEWGSTLQNKDWSYNYYDAGVYFSANTSSSWKPRIGMGVRYYDSRKDAHDSYLRFALSMGFTFCLTK